MKCSCFLNEKWNSGKWCNNDVMHWHYSEFLHKELAKTNPFLYEQDRKKHS